MNFEKTSTWTLSALVLGAIGFVQIPAAQAAPRPDHENATPVEQGANAKWEKLGDRTVDEKNDHDVIAVGRDDGRFREIQLKVEGSSLALADLVITFGDGSKFEPKVRILFDKGSTSRVIGLPGEGERRVIKRVDFKYANLPGGGRARVELWAR